MHPLSVTAGDWNGDGKPDLAVANFGSATVRILLGNGNETFQPKVDCPADIQPYSVTAGDYNGDGKPDLAVANFGSDNVSILLGKGDGTFQMKVDYAAGTQPHSVTAGDQRVRTAASSRVALHAACRRPRCARTVVDTNPKSTQSQGVARQGRGQWKRDAWAEWAPTSTRWLRP